MDLTPHFCPLISSLSLITFPHHWWDFYQPTFCPLNRSPVASYQTILDVTSIGTIDSIGPLHPYTFHLNACHFSGLLKIYLNSKSIDSLLVPDKGFSCSQLDFLIILFLTKFPHYNWYDIMHPKFPTLPKTLITVHLRFQCLWAFGPSQPSCPLSILMCKMDMIMRSH